MSYRNMRMADAHLSLDRLLDGIDAEKAPVLSDGGEGEWRICRAVDAEDESERELQLDNQRFVLLMVAESLLALAGLERLVPVLEQVVENGVDRQESICRLAVMRRVKKGSSERFYDRGVKALLAFFSPNEIKGETHVGKSLCL